MLSDVLLTWSVKIVSMVIGTMILVAALTRRRKSPDRAFTVAMIGCGVIVLSWYSWQVASIVLVMTMLVPVAINSLVECRQMYPPDEVRPAPKVR